MLASGRLMPMGIKFASLVHHRARNFLGARAVDGRNALVRCVSTCVYVTHKATRALPITRLKRSAYNGSAAAVGIVSTQYQRTSTAFLTTRVQRR
jgi:hypothetical protein